MKRLSQLAPRLARWFFSTILFAILLFGLAGHEDLPLLWVYTALWSGLALALIFAIDPDLARERWHPGPGGVDRKLPLVIGPLFLAHLVVAALDVGRFHWSDTVPRFLRIAALFFFTGSMTLLVSAVAVNRFFSSVVRIQQERGHRVVTEGPYRCVRHPGYFALCIGFPASALSLGSWWALAPVGVCVLLLLRRTAIEDRYLLENLEGYSRYAGQVRYRLLPGLW